MSQAPLRFGLFTPIVTTYSAQGQPWTHAGGPAELRAIAIAADRLGFHHLTCSEHVGVPDLFGGQFTRYYDPLATFGYMAAVTERIRFLTHVLVLPYNHPLAIAKRYGTLDRLAGGRLILGVGIGISRNEFDILGVDFDTRVKPYADGLRALRAAFGQRAPVYHGEHYDFEGLVIDPCGVQERVPIWLGGRTLTSLRQAVTLADGWDPFALSADAMSDMVARAKEWPEWSARSEPLDVAVLAEGTHDPRTPAGRAAYIDYLAAYRRGGATAVNLCFKAESLDDYTDQLAAFQEHVAPALA